MDIPHKFTTNIDRMTYSLYDFLIEYWSCSNLSVTSLFSCSLKFYQAAAYYYHGLILDEGNTEKSHGMAVAALQAADEYFKESKKACEAFNTALPLSR